jgi:AraC-like DNA-binding protein
MDDAEFDEHLRATGVTRLPSDPWGMVVRRMTVPAGLYVRPEVEVIGLLTPERPYRVEVNAGSVKQKLSLRRGDIALAVPGLGGTFKHDGFHGVICWIQMEAVIRVAQRIDPKLASTLTIRNMPGTRDPLLASLLVELSNESTDGAPSGAGYVQALADAFLMRLVKRYGQAGGESKVWGEWGDDGRIKRTLAYLDKHLVGASLADAARHVGISSPHLAELFKAATGETVGSFVRRRRLERARQLLDDDTLSIADVAERAGFAGASHFTTAFKAKFGVAPGAHRKVRQRSRPGV